MSPIDIEVNINVYMKYTYYTLQRRRINAMKCLHIFSICVWVTSLYLHYMDISTISKTFFVLNNHWTCVGVIRWYSNPALPYAIKPPLPPPATSLNGSQTTSRLLSVTSHHVDWRCLAHSSVTALPSRSCSNVSQSSSPLCSGERLSSIG